MIPVLRSKLGTEFAVIAPGGFRILAALDGLSKVLGQDLIITAGTNDHTAPDPHALGEAIDISVRDLAPPQIARAKTYLEQALGTDRFTVLYEVPDQSHLDPAIAMIAYVNPHATAPHIHIQVRKGTTYPPAPPPPQSNA